MAAHDTRRTFLTRLSGLGVAAFWPGRLARQDRLSTRSVPGTGETLPIVGLGSSKAVLQIPADGTEPLGAVMRMLLRYGGRVVDTSPRVEEVDAAFGRLLQAPDLRDSLFVAIKINTTGRDEGVRQMRQSQRLFGRRPFDLVQVESMTDVESHWPSLLEWKETGEARHIGVTVSSDAAHAGLEAFMRRESPDFVHMNYSVMEPHAEELLLPLAQDRGIAVLTNRPFLNGSYFRRVADRVLPEWAAEFDCTSWAQFSLKYILSHPAVTCALTETTSPGHMEENIRAALGRLPDQDMKRRMRRELL